MTLSSGDNANEQYELVGRLCNEDLDAASRNRLSDLLANDVEAQKLYVRYLDLQVAIRTQAQSLDDEDFALLEVQTALDAALISGSGEADAEKRDGAPSVAAIGLDLPSPSGVIRFSWRWDRLRSLAGHPFVWTAAAAILLVSYLIAAIDRTIDDPGQSAPLANSLAPAPESVVAPARLRGTVGARWAGAKLELPEGEQFEPGQQLELVEGLAEVCFSSGARVVLQGPAIFQIRDDCSASVSVGRVAAVVPQSASSFTVHTSVADLTSRDTEFGAEVDVDGSLVTQVYAGEVAMHFTRGDAAATTLQLAGDHGARVDASTGRATPLTKPSGFHFVRYLPNRETLINLADVVADGGGSRQAYHSGISLLDGGTVNDYGAPADGDGQYRLAKCIEFVDGVFIPDGKRGPVQVDSIGRYFSEFPPTAGDCWGGAIMARRPREEDSLPRIRLEFHGDNYGYVNWLHIASKADELSPQGLGLIGMHSNCGITFDLHAIRARHPNKKIVRFRALVGNLESRPESKTNTYAADAWVIIDGQLRHQRKGFCREDGPEVIDVPLADRDRFLVLAVTDAGGDTAYDWVAFGDAVIEMTSLEGISADGEVVRPGPEPADYDEGVDAARERDASANRAFRALAGSTTEFLGWSGSSLSNASDMIDELAVNASGFNLDPIAICSLEAADWASRDQPGETRLATSP